MASALLISTYDLGRQPFGLASPAAWLRDAGVAVTCADVSRERLSEAAVREADVVAFYLPMHTATRLALPVIDRVRSLNPGGRLIAYGLYAPLNADILRRHDVTTILGGEFEEDLVRAVTGRGTVSKGHLPRLQFKVPDRTSLPPLDRYVTLQVGAERQTTGYTEASRGCKHQCRHCPIVPVYGGQFRVVSPDVVLADIAAQVRAGATHITFGDPDFFNGPRHAVAIVERLARELPGITYDVTIKVEHLLRHAALLPVLRDTGCAFVTTAVESIDDRVLEHLAKGHTRADFERAVAQCRALGLTLAPTFVPFTPWTSLDSYRELLHLLDRLDLVDQVAPIQLAIRLLIPEGSLMLTLPDVRAVIKPFNPASLTYPWSHPDPRVDQLQATIAQQVGVQITASRRAVFSRIWELAHADLPSAPLPLDRGAMPRATIRYLNEPWYC